MKCLVAGGCGFIGWRLVGRLVEHGHEVVILDDLSSDERSGGQPNSELTVGSITDFSAVIAAAWARVERPVADPIGTHDVNVTGNLDVLRAAHLAGAARVINSSGQACTACSRLA